VEGKHQAQRKDAMLHYLLPERPQDHVVDIQTLKDAEWQLCWSCEQ